MSKSKGNKTSSEPLGGQRPLGLPTPSAVFLHRQSSRDGNASRSTRSARARQFSCSTLEHLLFYVVCERHRRVPGRRRRRMTTSTVGPCRAWRRDRERVRERLAAYDARSPGRAIAEFVDDTLHWYVPARATALLTAIKACLRHARHCSSRLSRCWRPRRPAARHRDEAWRTCEGPPSRASQNAVRASHVPVGEVSTNSRSRARATCVVACPSRSRTRSVRRAGATAPNVEVVLRGACRDSVGDVRIQDLERLVFPSWSMNCRTRPRDRVERKRYPSTAAGGEEISTRRRSERSNDLQGPAPPPPRCLPLGLRHLLALGSRDQTDIPRCGT